MIYDRPSRRNCILILDKIGFTIVEMYAIIAIIAIIVSISIPTITRYIYRVKVNSATSALTSRLRLTRQRAISRKTNYVFDYDTSLNTYQMFRDDNKNWAHDTGEEVFGPYEVSKEHPGVTLNSDSPLPHPVAFTPKGTVIAQNGSPAYGDFIFCNTRGDTGRIMILPSGFIKSK